MPSRYERNLGQSRQEKIKNVPAPPTRSDGTDGDMWMCNGTLYIKMGYEWHQFNSVPRSIGAEEKPYDLETNGYEILSSGLIIQWGYIDTGAQTGTETFPIAFPNACFTVAASSFFPSVVAQFTSCVVKAQTTTGFDWYAGGALGFGTYQAGMDINYIAMGN